MIKFLKESYLLMNKDKEGYDLIYEPFEINFKEELPRLLLVITPKMKELFMKHAKAIIFDFTYGLIKKYK